MFNRIFTKLEIAFWDLIIPLMSESRFMQTCLKKIVPMLQNKTSRRNIHLIGLASIVMIVIITGYIVGVTIFSIHQTDAIQIRSALASSADTPISGLPNGQRNLLLIIADDLSVSHPYLESIWLVLSMPPESRLVIMPVLPSISSEDSGMYKQLAGVFRIIKDDIGKQLDPAFLRIVRSRDIWWTGYLVLDRSSLAQILDILDDPKQGNSRALVDIPNGSLFVDSLPDAREDPALALWKQVNIFREICWRTSNLDSITAAQLVRNSPDLLAGHFVTDLRQDPALDGFSNFLIPVGGFSCEFPTLFMQANASR